MAFVQIIDCKTDRLDDLNRLMDTWAEQTRGRRTAGHAVVATDRADTKHVVEIVEFPPTRRRCGTPVCPRPTGSSGRWWRSAMSRRPSPTSTWSATPSSTRRSPSASSTSSPRATSA
ncbi:hypothetical protein ACFQ0M_20350 [Kitasatospora aburaviensis]